MIQLLLKDGRVRWDLPTRYGQTPLMVACNGRHAAAAMVLLDSGYVYDIGGVVTSLMKFCCPLVPQQPLRNSPPHSPPILSVSFLYYFSVELSINASDADGYTALHYAQSTDLEEVAMVSGTRATSCFVRLASDPRLTSSHPPFYFFPFLSSLPSES